MRVRGLNARQDEMIRRVRWTHGGYTSVTSSSVYSPQDLGSINLREIALSYPRQHRAPIVGPLASRVIMRTVIPKLTFDYKLLSWYMAIGHTTAKW